MPAAPSSAPRSGRARPAPPTCCCTTTWATSTARWARGVLRAAAWARSRRRSAPRSGQRRHDPQRRAGRRRSWCSNGRATGVVLDERRGDRRAARGLQPRCAPHVPRDRWTRRTCRTSSCAQVRNFKIRGSSGKLNIALDGLPRFPAIPQGSPCHARRHARHRYLEMMERAYDDWKDGRWSRAPYIDMLIPVADRPDHGARRQALHVGVRAVLPLRARRRASGRREAPGLRRHGDRHHRAPQPELQGA